MEFGKGIFVGLFVSFVAVCICGPTGNGFLNINCNEIINCTSVSQPICCTDGITYDSPCKLSKENQRRVCFEGKFNPIAKVHDGPCNSTTPAP